jgi:LysR family nitrogen assimilation transcriptional regulator
MDEKLPYRSDTPVLKRSASAERLPSLAPFMDSLDLKQIRCFVAAYEEGSFSKAAEREHCTQPGLSVYIQRLETMLAHRLFERKARGVTPTIAGKHFYSCCSEVLKTVNVAKQKMLDLVGNSATSINIGVSPTLLKGVLPWMLADYLKAHPYVDVRLAEAYSGTLTDWVVSGELQVAIVTDPPIHLGLKTTHFYRDRLVLVTRASGKGKRRRHFSQRRSSELRDLKLILPSARHSLRQVIENAALRLGTSSSGRILEVDGMLGTLELVRNSDWATVVASIAVMDDVRQGRLTAEPIYEPELWLDFYLIRTKDALLSTACQNFLDYVQKSLARVAKSRPPAWQPQIA